MGGPPHSGAVAANLPAGGVVLASPHHHNMVEVRAPFFLGLIVVARPHVVTPDVDGPPMEGLSSPGSSK